MTYNFAGTIKVSIDNKTKNNISTNEWWDYLISQPTREYYFVSKLLLLMLHIFLLQIWRIFLAFRALTVVG